jgi:hypothetical protein
MDRGGLPQFQIRRPDGSTVCRSDIGFPDALVRVELDSGAYHMDRQTFRKDRAVQNQTELLGWRTLRYTWWELIARPGSVIAEVAEALVLPQPSFCPRSPTRWTQVRDRWLIPKGTQVPGGPFSLPPMPAEKEIPQLAAELVDLSKQYLRQETLAPARRLGRLAGFGLAAAVCFAGASLLFGLGLFSFLRRVLPDNPWWGVLARLFTGVAAGGGAALIGWRMTR